MIELVVASVLGWAVFRLSDRAWPTIKSVVKKQIQKLPLVLIRKSRLQELEHQSRALKVLLKAHDETREKIAIVPLTNGTEPTAWKN